MLVNILVDGTSTDSILRDLLVGEISSEQILRDLLVKGISDLVFGEKYPDSNWRLFPLVVFVGVLPILMFGEMFANVILGGGFRALFPAVIIADLGIFRL